MHEGNEDGYVTLCSKLYDAFSPHGDGNRISSDESMRGWDVCTDLHQDELELECASHKPYSSIVLLHATLVELKLRANQVSERPTSAQMSKSRKKAPNNSASTVNIRRSKSSRTVSITTPLLSPHRIASRSGVSTPSSGRYANPRRYGLAEPSIRYMSKFPMVFNRIKDIDYQFNHYQQHEQHAEHYRNSYTYLLIRNFRDLRSQGLTGTKLHAALRLNMCTSIPNQIHLDSSSRVLTQGLVHPIHHRDCRHHSQHRQQTTPPQKPGATPPPVVYYSENCQTGPVVATRGESGKASSSRATSSGSGVCSGCTNLPKSTMEMNSIMVKSSPQRPFGEQEGAYKSYKGFLRSPKPWKPPCGEGRRRSAGGNQMAMVVGSSFIKGKKKGIIRKMSPLGRIPVTIRRSSPSIRGKRDPSGSSLEGAKYLSIAMATHTVTSPYCRNDDVSDVISLL